MANQRVPKFSLNKCAQSPQKTFMCPKFCTNPVLMYTKCHISTNLSSFLKLCLLYCQKYLPFLQQIADSLKKISLVGTLLVAEYEKTSWSSGNVFIFGAGGLRFKSWTGQIEHSVANSSPLLRHFFIRSCVAQVQ